MLLQTRTRARPRLESEVAARGALVAGALAVAVVAVITGLQVTIAALDETVYKFAAVQHANDMPFGVFHENTSRGMARLYSLVVSPLFDVFSGDVAIRLARALNGVFFAATAIPVALLARRVTRSPWSAAAAGVLSVAVPWLTLATIMFSESLAYLLFACTALAMLRALEAPGWRRDLLVIGLFAALVLTRVQFIVLAVGWVALVVLWERRRWRRFPVTTGCVAAVVVGGLGLLVVGVLSGRLRDLAGPYYDIANRDGVPGNFGLGLLWEVEMLALGVGLLPAILAAAWFRGALARRAADPERFRFAVLALTLIGVLFAGTLWAQGGWLDFRSEERYFIYAVPFMWIGAVAAVELRDLPARWLAVAGLALWFVLVTVPIAVQSTGEQAFLGPVSMSAGHALPRLEGEIGDLLGIGGLLSARDILGLVCVILVGVALLLWRRGTRARWLALVPAVALQLFVGAYSFSAVYGKLENIGGLTDDVAFSDLGWVDRTTSGTPRVTLLDNQSDGREGGQRNTVFWNDEVTDIYTLAPLKLEPPGFPVFTLPTVYSQLMAGLRPALPLAGLAVSAVDSPHFQVAGEEVRRSPDGTLALVRPARPATLTWLADTVDTDGHIVRGTTLHAQGGSRLTLELVRPIGGDATASLTVAFGKRSEKVDFGPGLPEEARVAFDLCQATGMTQGRIDVNGNVHVGNNRFSAGRLVRARLERC